MDIWSGEGRAIFSLLLIPSVESFRGYRNVYIEEAKTKTNKKTQDILQTLEV